MCHSGHRSRGGTASVDRWGIVKRLISIETTGNVLVPAWIAVFGCVSVAAPPFSVGVSLALLLVGVLVIPAVAVIARAGRWRAGHVG